MLSFASFAVSTIEHTLTGQAVALFTFLLMLVFHSHIINRFTTSQILTEPVDALDKYIDEVRRITELGIECSHCGGLYEVHTLEGDTCPDCGYKL